MNSPLPDVPLNVLSDDDIPAAIPGLIDAAMAALDADKDISRRYLSRASALLHIKRRTGIGADSGRRLERRGGLMTWQLNRLVDYIEIHLAKKMSGRELSEQNHGRDMRNSRNCLTNLTNSGTSHHFTEPDAMLCKSLQTESPASVQS
jgi:hypothetical protein